MKTLQGGFAHNEIIILGAVRYGRINKADDGDRPKLLGVHQSWKYQTFSLAEMIVHNESEHTRKLKRIEKKRKKKRNTAVCIDMTEQDVIYRFDDVLAYAKKHNISWKLIMKIARDKKITVEEVIKIMEDKK